MASGLNPTTGDAFLKTYYPPQFVVNTIAKHSSKLLNVIKHFEGVSGRTYNFFSMMNEFPSGSADFDEAMDTAKNNVTPMGNQFAVPTYENHGVVRITNKFIKETRNDAGAWMKGLRFAMDSQMRVLAHRDSVALYTTGYGELAKITYTAGQSVFTCQTITHVNRFYNGMKLVFSSSLNAAVLRVGTAYVKKINYQTGVITVANSAGTVTALDSLITSPATNDWCFTKGDRQDSATPARLRPIGLPGWFPTTAPTSDDLGYGVDRGIDSRYGGSIITAGNTLFDRFVNAAQTASSFGNAEQLFGVCSPAKYTELTQLLSGDRRFVDVQARGAQGFKTLVVYADGIELPVVSDKYCDDVNSYVVEPPNFRMNSMGPAPAVANEDGNTMLRASDSSALEARLEGYSNYTAENPAACAVIVNP